MAPLIPKTPRRPIRSDARPVPPAPLSAPPSAVALVDRAVAPLVAELEQLPIARAIAGGTITRADYANLLQSLLTLHRSLEHALAAASHLTGFDHASFRREEALARDLHLLRSHLPVRASEPLDQFESHARAWLRPPGVALLGALLAIERARRRSLQIVRPLAQALHVKLAPRCGLDYHLDGSERASRRLHELEAWIDAHVRRPERAQELVEGAVQAMQTLVAVHRGVTG